MERRKMVTKKNVKQDPMDTIGATKVDSLAKLADSPICDPGEALRGYEFIRDLTLLEGQGVKDATYLGHGEPAPIADPATGDVREVPTILLKIKNVTYRMLASAMLDRLLGAVKEGQIVAIVNRGLTETRKGRRMTVWDVGVRS
jgi:hypothetical protein